MWATRAVTGWLLFYCPYRKIIPLPRVTVGQFVPLREQLPPPDLVLSLESWLLTESTISCCFPAANDEFPKYTELMISLTVALVA